MERDIMKWLREREREREREINIDDEVTEKAWYTEKEMNWGRWIEGDKQRGQSEREIMKWL